MNSDKIIKEGERKMKYELKNNGRSWWVKGMVVEGEINRLNFFKNKPIFKEVEWFGKNEAYYPVFDIYLKELYPFVSCENKEPTLIQDILDRYEVIENEKI